MTTQLIHLPDEMLVRILSYLTFDFRLNVMRLVCKRLHDLCQVASLKKVYCGNLSKCHIHKFIHNGSLRLHSCIVQSIESMNKVFSSHAQVLTNVYLRDVRFIASSAKLNIDLLKQLKTLRISNLNENVFHWRSGMGHQLTRLNVQYTSVKVEDILSLPRIHSLSLSNISNDSLSYLDRFPTLNKLSLISSEDSPLTSFEMLPQMRQLVHLKVRRGDFVCLKGLNGVINLRELHLQDCRLQSFKYFPPLQQLTRISIKRGRCYDDCDFHGLEQCPHLRCLELEYQVEPLSPKIKHTLRESLPYLPQLTHLTLSSQAYWNDCESVSNDFGFLKKVPNIINLTCTQFLRDRRNLQTSCRIPPMLKMKELILMWMSSYNEMFLSRLSVIPNLVVLDVSACKFSTLRRLPPLQHLEVLNVGMADAEYSPLDFSSIAKLPNLQSLTVQAPSLHRVIGNLPHDLTSLRSLTLFCESTGIITDERWLLSLLRTKVAPNDTHIDVHVQAYITSEEWGNNPRCHVSYISTLHDSKNIRMSYSLNKCSYLH